MNKMKYIIIDNGLYETPIIFDEATDHLQLAIDLHGGMIDGKKLKERVVSAGFVTHAANGMSCYGRSVSLNLEARPEEDTRLINKMLGVIDD